MSRVFSSFPSRPFAWQQPQLPPLAQPRALFAGQGGARPSAGQLDAGRPDALQDARSMEAGRIGNEMTASGPRITMMAASEAGASGASGSSPIEAIEAVADDANLLESPDPDHSESPEEVATADPAKLAFLQVLTRAKEGDRKAFEEIYQMYHRRIYNAVYGMLGDADDAQDVTQDVFIRLHYALPTLRADEAFSTYLYRIALNLCRDRARRKKRVRFQSIDTPRAGEDGDVEPMDFPDNAKLPEDKLTGDELQTRVREAVKTLSHDHKTVIMMHHFQGMEVNDIARILDIPTGTVKSRLARGRDQLHRKLRGYLLP